MGYIRVITYNTLTKRLLTSWDIQALCNIHMRPMGSWKNFTYMTGPQISTIHVLVPGISSRCDVDCHQLKNPENQAAIVANKKWYTGTFIPMFSR